MGARNSRCVPNCATPCPPPCPPPMICFPAPRPQCRPQTACCRKKKPCIAILPPPPPPVYGFPQRPFRPMLPAPPPMFAPRGSMPLALPAPCPQSMGAGPFLPFPPSMGALPLPFPPSMGAFPLPFGAPPSCFSHHPMHSCPPPFGIPGPYLPHSTLPPSPVLPAPLSHAYSPYGAAYGPNASYPCALPSTLDSTQIGSGTVLDNQQIAVSNPSNCLSILNDQYSGLTGQPSYQPSYPPSYQMTGHPSYGLNSYGYPGGLCYPGMYGNLSARALPGISGSTCTSNQFPTDDIENNPYIDSLNAENLKKSRKNLDQQLNDINDIQNLANAELSLRQALADHNANEVQAGGEGNLNADSSNIFNQSPYGNLINQAIANNLAARQASYRMNPYSPYSNPYASSPYSGMNAVNPYSAYGAPYQGLGGAGLNSNPYQGYPFNNLMSSLGKNYLNASENLLGKGKSKDDESLFETIYDSDASDDFKSGKNLNFPGEDLNSNSLEKKLDSFSVGDIKTSGKKDKSRARLRRSSPFSGASKNRYGENNYSNDANNLGKGIHTNLNNGVSTNYGANPNPVGSGANGQKIDSTGKENLGNGLNINSGDQALAKNSELNSETARYNQELYQKLANSNLGKNGSGQNPYSGTSEGIAFNQNSSEYQGKNPYSGYNSSGQNPYSGTSEGIAFNQNSSEYQGKNPYSGYNSSGQNPYSGTSEGIAFNQNSSEYQGKNPYSGYNSSGQNPYSGTSEGIAFNQNSSEYQGKNPYSGYNSSGQNPYSGNAEGTNGQNIPGSGSPYGTSGIPGSGYGQDVHGSSSPYGTSSVPGSGAPYEQGVPSSGSPYGTSGIPGSGSPYGTSGVPGSGSPYGTSGVPGSGLPYGQGVPGSVSPYGQGVPGSGSPYGQGVPGSGSPYGQGVPGSGSPYVQGVPGSGSPYEQGVPGSGSPYGTSSVPGSGSPYGQGVPGSGSPYGTSGIPGSGSPYGTSGVPGSGLPYGQGVPGSVSPYGQGVPGSGSPYGQGVPGSGSPYGQGVPGSGSPYGTSGIPGSGTPYGQVVPGSGSGSPYEQGVPSSGSPYGTSGQPSSGSPYRQGVPGSGSPYGQGVPGSGSPYGQGLPGSVSPYGTSGQPGADYHYGTNGVPDSGSPYGPNVYPIESGIENKKLLFDDQIKEDIKFNFKQRPKSFNVEVCVEKPQCPPQPQRKFKEFVIPLPLPDYCRSNPNSLQSSFPSSLPLRLNCRPILRCRSNKRNDSRSKSRARSKSQIIIQKPIATIEVPKQSTKPLSNSNLSKSSSVQKSSLPHFLPSSQLSNQRPQLIKIQTSKSNSGPATRTLISTNQSVGRSILSKRTSTLNSSKPSSGQTTTLHSSKLSSGQATTINSSKPPSSQTNRSNASSSKRTIMQLE